MKKRQSKTSQANRSPEPTDRKKPFVLPELRREADLVDSTAERIFTFNGPES